jgi:hypothetical protein
MIVDVNVHEMPESDLVGILAILMRSPGLKVFALAEVEVGGRKGWRFEAEVIEDMTYDGMCGESAERATARSSTYSEPMTACWRSTRPRTALASGSTPRTWMG